MSEGRKQVVYVVLLTAAWFSLLVCVSAFTDPSAHPLLRAVRLEGLFSKIWAAVEIVLAPLILLTRTDQQTVIGAIRRFLCWPLEPRRWRIALPLLCALPVAIQLPVLLSARSRFRTCGSEFIVCVGTAECGEEVSRTSASVDTFVRVWLWEQLTTISPDGAILWSGSPGYYPYGSSRRPTEVCVNSRYELACGDLGALLLRAENHGKTQLTVLGFSLREVYSATYPDVAFNPGGVLQVAPLVLGVDSSTPLSSASKVYELKPGESGVLEVPITAKYPPKARHVSANELCLRFSLRKPASCIADHLAMFTQRQGALHCNVWTPDELMQAVSKEMDALEPLTSLDPARALALWRPAEAETLFASRYERLDPTAVGLAIDLLEIMAELTGPQSLAVLRQELERGAASTRIRALEALSRRDTSVDKTATYRRWAVEGPADVSARAFEYLPHDMKAGACQARLQKRSCEDGMVAMHCGMLRAPELGEVLKAWTVQCPS